MTYRKATHILAYVVFPVVMLAIGAWAVIAK